MKSLSFYWFLKTEESQLPYPQTTEAASILFQCTGCFTTFLSLRKNTVDCSSQQHKNHLPLLYLYFSSTIFISHNQTAQVCLQVKQEGEEGKKAENYGITVQILCSWKKNHKGKSYL